MSDFYYGHNRILEIKISGVFKPVGCLTDNSISESSNFLSTTTSESSGWETSIPISQQYSISFTGIQIVANDIMNTDKLSYFSLRELKRNKTLIEWRITSGHNDVVDEGKGYISNIGESNAIGEVLTFSGEIVGYGLPIARTVPVVVSVSDDTQDEGTDLSHLITLSAPTFEDTIFSFDITSGTATEGVDWLNTPVFTDGVTYDAAEGEITIPSGVTTFTVSYPTQTDAESEGSEFLYVFCSDKWGIGNITNVP